MVVLVACPSTVQDHALVKEHFDHQKAETQREQMRNEIDRMKRLLENNDSVVHKQVCKNIPTTPLARVEVGYSIIAA